MPCTCLGCIRLMDACSCTSLGRPPAYARSDELSAVAGEDVWVHEVCGKPRPLVAAALEEAARDRTVNKRTDKPREVRNMVKVSNSEIRKFKRCRRSWWLSYYRRLRPIHDGVGPLSIGNMLHSVLEAYYTQESRDPATFAWEPILSAIVKARVEDERLPENLVPDMLADAELARIMLIGYFEWLQDDGADSDLRILSAEEEVEAFLGEIEGEQVWLIGKLDVQAEQISTGDRMFVDHKSCQSLGDLPKIGALDEQLKTYGLLQRLNGTPEGQRAVGGMWNMLRKVKRTARSNPPFYGRAGVRHNEETYRTMYRRIWGEVRDMLLVRHQLDAGADHHVVAYPNPTRDCSWDCPFYRECPLFDDGSDVEAVLAESFEQHDPYARYVELEKS